jgi:Rad3-related DNA helicase
MLILDEAHDADKELEGFLTLEVTLEDCQYVQSKFLKSANLQTWKDWAFHHHRSLNSQLERLEQIPPQDAEGAAERRRIKNVLTKLKRLSMIEPLDWILDDDGKHVAKFAPMKVSRYAEAHLFRSIPHVLLMSATMTRKTTQLLGIDPDALSFWECPSRFDVARRPIISVNTAPAIRVSHRMSEDDKYMWMRRIDRLIDTRIPLGWKGIIHTVSYLRMKELLASSTHRDIMIVHDKGGTREAIRIFKEAQDCRILVSPSVITGYDFPHDECRWQIVGKVPLPDMR